MELHERATQQLNQDGAGSMDHDADEKCSQQHGHRQADEQSCDNVVPRHNEHMVVEEKTLQGNHGACSQKQPYGS